MNWVFYFVLVFLVLLPVCIVIGAGMYYGALPSFDWGMFDVVEDTFFPLVIWGILSVVLFFVMQQY